MTGKEGRAWASRQGSRCRGGFLRSHLGSDAMLLAAPVGCCLLLPPDLQARAVGMRQQGQRKLQGCAPCPILEVACGGGNTSAPAIIGGSGRAVAIRSAAACRARTRTALARRANGPMALRMG